MTEWLVRSLLDYDDKCLYEELCAEYRPSDKFCSEQWEIYYSIQRPAWDAFRAARDIALAEFESRKAPLWEAYMKVVPPDWDKLVVVPTEVRDEFNKAKDLAYDTYKKAIEPAEIELKRVTDYLHSEMDKIVKPAVAKCRLDTGHLEHASRKAKSTMFFKLYGAEK
jgi:hypothetical protein